MLVTDTVRGLTRTSLGVRFVPRGRPRLKGIAEPIALYRVLSASEEVVLSRAMLPGSLRGRRLPIVAFAAAGLLVLTLGAAILGAAMLREGLGSVDLGPSGSAAAAISGSAAPSPSASATAGPFPTAEEQRLLALVDPANHDRCQRAASEDIPILIIDLNEDGVLERHHASPAAGIDCSLGGISAPDRLWYWLMFPEAPPTPDAIIYNQAGRLQAPADSCSTQVPALETWSFGAGGGALVCFETVTGAAILMWDYNGRPHLGKAIRDDRNMVELLEWWLAEARFAPD